MATLTTRDGTRIFYKVRGEGRPPFIFIHGWCSNLAHWDAQTRHFGKRHRVLAVDRRGQGRSDVPPGGYTGKQHAADLAEVARKEKIRSAIVVGHAGGGPTTLEFARSYPHLARAVVMVDSMVGPKARIGDPSDPAGRALGALIDSFEGPGGAAEFKKMYSGLFSRHAGPAGRQAVADAAKTPREVVAAELESLAINTLGIAKRLEQPVLWLTAAAANEAAVGKAFRNVQFARTVGSGHFPHIEVPEQTNAMIERFVSTL
ncbi:MAG: alpha/beta hydrolase [Myxococcales bacterium]|nr:alpha/beta hydrolase [Myxococcales bacterium]